MQLQDLGTRPSPSVAAMRGDFERPNFDTAGAAGTAGDEFGGFDAVGHDDEFGGGLDDEFGGHGGGGGGGAGHGQHGQQVSPFLASKPSQSQQRFEPMMFEREVGWTSSRLSFPLLSFPFLPLFLLSSFLFLRDRIHPRQ